MGQVYTLNGPVDAADLGPVLPHEHLPMHYHGQDDDEFEPGSKCVVREWYARILDDLQATPFRTLVDVTMMGHGRDVCFRQELLARRPITWSWPRGSTSKQASPNGPGKNPRKTARS